MVGHEADELLDDAIYDDAPLGPRPLAFVALLAAIVLVVFVLGSAFMERVGLAAVDGAPKLVEIPEVIGHEAERAAQRLRDDGFDVTIDAVPNVEVPPGQVVDQRPLAGERVEVGSTIELAVSAGADFTRVPDVRGSLRDELPLLLISYGLGLGEITFQEDDRLVDEAISQTPAPGELVARGTAVQVVLSSGPPLVEIPDIRDLPEVDARRALRDAGFEVTTQDRRSHAVRRGYAMSTDPADEAPRGSRIVLHVSAGPPPPTTAPPETTPDPTVTLPPDASGSSGSSRVNGMVTYEPFVG